MQKQNISCVLVLILVMTLTCGCAGLPIRPDASVPLKHGEGAKYTDEGNVISALVKMEMKQAGHNYVADGTLIMKMPSYLRLEVRGILGGTILCVTVNPQRMSYLCAVKKRILSGQTGSRKHGEIFLLPLEVEDIMKMLTGSILDMTNPNGELLDQGKDDRPQIALDKSGFHRRSGLKIKDYPNGNDSIKIKMCCLRSNMFMTKRGIHCPRGSIF